jgi:peptide/nickel transport system substrate-binding protein
MRRRKVLKRFFIPLVIILLAVCLLSACSSSSSTTSSSTTQTQAATSSSVKPSTTAAASTTAATTAATTKTPKSGGIFKFADPRAPSTTLGWFAEAGASGGMWTGPNLEALIEVDLAGNLLPCLATGWTISDDLKTITFNIRKGVKFHDGSDLNASIVKWNIDQMIAAKVGVNYTFMTSVDVVDDYTLKISISQYNNSMLNTLASVYMVSKTTYDAKGKDYLRWNPVGTGPFKFVSFQRDVMIKYTKFENYWRPGQPYLDGVEEYYVSDPVTMSAAFLAGDYDAIGADLSSVFYDLQQKGYTILKSYAGAYCLAPDSKNADSPWSNLKVRQALDYAVDRAALVKARGFGYWSTVYQFANPDTPSYNKNLGDRAYDPAKAKQLLKDAGYPNGFSTKIYADIASTDKDAVTAIQAYMQAVGINAELNMLDFASYGNYRTKGWNNAVLAGMVGFFANPNQATDFYWAKTASYYPSLNKTDDLQNLHLASLASKNFDPALYQKVTQYEYDNTLCIPLWAGSRGDAVKPYVKDTGLYQMSTWAGWRPYNAWLDK